MEEGGSTSDESGTTVEMLNNHNLNPNQMNLDVGIEGSDDSELDLGLGLGLSLGGVVGSRNLKLIPRNFAPNDLTSLLSRPLVVPPSSTSSGNDKNSTVGTKRAASPTGPSQAVGWPPVKTYRMNSMANQAKPIATEEHNGEFEENKGKDMIYGINEKGNAKSKERVPAKRSLFVKVRMDGDPIGRKVDLSVHSSYASLAQTLEEMFINTTVEKSNGSELALMPKVSRPSKLLDGSSEHVLTYEDKDGDWMLVGDVPWGMFMSSVKKLRITRTSEANGLAPRSEERT